MLSGVRHTGRRGEFQSHHFQIRGENIENIFEGKRQKRLSVFERHLKSCNTHGVFIRRTFKKYLWKSFEWQNIQREWPFLTEHNRATLHPNNPQHGGRSPGHGIRVCFCQIPPTWEWVTHTWGERTGWTETPSLQKHQNCRDGSCSEFQLRSVWATLYQGFLVTISRPCYLLQPNELGYRSICNHCFCFCFSGFLIS